MIELSLIMITSLNETRRPTHREKSKVNAWSECG